MLGTCPESPRARVWWCFAPGSARASPSYAFVERACRRGCAARYVRWRRLPQEIAVGRGDGSYTRMLTLPRQARPARHRRLDARPAPRRRTVRPHRGHRGPCRTRLDPSSPPSSQSPTGPPSSETPNKADAIYDHLLHDARRIELKGRSLQGPSSEDDMSTGHGAFQMFRRAQRESSNQCKYHRHKAFATSDRPGSHASYHVESDAMGALGSTSGRGSGAATVQPVSAARPTALARSGCDLPAVTVGAARCQRASEIERT